MKLTDHLDWHEVLAGSGVARPEDLPPGIRENLERAARLMFEPLRILYDHPLLVIPGGGYRSPETNKRVGGARNSQHVQGLALDLVPAGKMQADFDRLHDLAVRLQREKAIPPGGIGVYKTGDGRWRFLHVDARGVPARWHSGRVDGLVA